MSDGGNQITTGVSISDLAGVGDVGKEIVKAISAAIGTVYRPTAIRREGRAEAEVEAMRIEKRAMAEAKARLIENDTEATIEARAVSRMRMMETRRQLALETTVDEAFERAEEASKAQSRPLDEDWTNAFITHAQEITGEELRGIWARILSDQATEGAPTVSRATLDAVRLLEPAMARQFMAAMRMWAAMGQVMHLDDGPEGMMNLHMNEMQALEEIGLLRRFERDEANLEFTDGVILSFFDGGMSMSGTRINTAQRNPENWLTQASSTRIRIDRMGPTWRGQELTAVLIEGLYDAMGKADFTQIAPGYHTEADRLNVLTDWAAQISDRGYLVVLNTLKTQKDPDAFRSSLDPRYVMVEENEAWAWRELTEAERNALGEKLEA